MRTARRISQILFLIFFLWLFFQATYPYDTPIPSDLFLRVSPLVALATMISSTQFISKLFLALIILFLTIFLGRFFCGWICPLGTIIDGTDHLIRRKKQKVGQRESLRFRSWKFAILVAILVASVLSVQFSGFFDPTALLTRTFTTSLYPLFVFFSESVLEVLMEIKFLEESLLGFYDFLHAKILPLAQPRFQESVLILLIFLGILFLGLAARRFWCRNLCPLGALLGLFSKFRLTQRVVSEACTDCGICQSECRMNAIEDDYTVSSTVECIECMECVAVCPTGAITYKFGLPASTSRVDLSRRRLIQSVVGGILAVGVIKTGYLHRSSKGKAIRPPGALEEEQFLDRCIRCHECIRICATTGGCLQPALLESGWEGIWTPISVPRQGYCEYNCNLCGQVCPTGAIHPLDVAAKQKTKMGVAYFDKSRCIPWYRGEDCIVCEEHCPTPDKAIKFEVKEVIRPDGTKRLVKLPYVVEELCVGCGICVTRCPVVGEAGIFVTNAQEERWKG